MRQALLLVAACAFASAAAAEDVRLCRGGLSQVAADGRLLNHFPYAPVAGTALVRQPRTLPGRCQGVHRDMLADLEALMARARADPEIRSLIIALSCFRTRQHQNSIFCRGPSIQVRAYQVAPPGFSEHATGLAVDFGDRRGGRCNLERCFANTAVGRWLARNAPNFGFELSFPDGNAQGVAFEPWHWRWVGRGEDARALQAKAVFAAARLRFPSAGSAAPSAAPLPAPPAALPIAPAAPAANAGAGGSHRLSAQFPQTHHQEEN